MPIPYKLQIFVDDDTRKALKDIAYHEETTLQRVAETALEEYLARKRGAMQSPTPRQRRRASVGT